MIQVGSVLRPVGASYVAAHFVPLASASVAIFVRVSSIALLAAIVPSQMSAARDAAS